MTAAKGMLWKTAWKRRSGGFVQQPPVDMWFLTATYKAVAASPSFAEGPAPFWFGFIALGSGPSSVDAQVVSTNGIFVEYLDTVTNGQDNESLLVNVNPTNGVDGLVILDPTNPPPATPTVDPLVPYLPGVTPTVGFVYVYPDPANASQSIFQTWIDGQWIATLSGPAYVAATNGVEIQGIFNGLVGGVGTLTPTDITNWFANVKQQLQVVAAPGMTDIWSATAVAPAAPGVLPNGGTGQSLNLTAGGTNTLMSVVFNY